MRKSILVILSGLMFLNSVNPVFAKDLNLSIGKDLKKGIYVDVTIANIDAPGQPISVGQRFRLKANCVINVDSLLNTKPKDSSGNIVGTSKTTSEWNAYCGLSVWQKDKPENSYLLGNTYLYGIDGSDQFTVNTRDLASFSFIDEVIRAESTGEIFVETGGELWATVYNANSQGKIVETDVTSGISQVYVSLFTPLPRAKTDASSKIIELDGEEESDDPLLTIKKENSNSYFMSLLNYRPKTEVKIRATRKGMKSYVFIAKTDSDGDLLIRAKRNLKGYKIELVDGVRSVLSRQITS